MVMFPYLAWRSSVSLLKSFNLMLLSLISCVKQFKHILVSKIPFPNTLSKCPGDHPILHRGSKLNSKISVGKYKKTHCGQLIFHRGAKLKLCSKNEKM